MSAHLRGLTNDQVLVQHVTVTKRVLKNLRVKKTDPLFSKVAAGALYEEDDQVDVDDLSKLARENILTVDLATGLVAFNSRHIRTFFTDSGLLWPIVCRHSLLAHESLCLFGHRCPLSWTEAFK